MSSDKDVAALLAEAAEEYGDEGFEAEYVAPTSSSSSSSALQPRPPSSSKVQSPSSKGNEQVRGGKAENEGEEEEEEEEEEEYGGDGESELNVSLRISCYRGEGHRVRTLLDKGASVSARDRHGWTSFHWATQGGHVGIMEDLLRHFSKNRRNGKGLLEAKDFISGWCPLHLACVQAHVPAAQFLVDSGANIDALNALGEKPWECIPNKHANTNRLHRVLGRFEVVKSETMSKEEKERELEEEEGESGNRDRGESEEKDGSQRDLLRLARGEQQDGTSRED